MKRTPLAEEIEALIASEGPITLASYMELCLGHPHHGYYTTRDPLGAAGDFVTSPEISQMFGELLGLWVAEAWLRLGAPPDLALVELGPGRGTLMADAMRALTLVPALQGTLALHLVETSPVLRARQKATLAGVTAPIAWHADLDTVPRQPFVLIANEFLDAVAMRQFEKRADGWHERVVGLGPTGGLALGLSPALVPPGLIPRAFLDAPLGAVFERAPLREAIVGALCERMRETRGTALLIDYGPARSGLGDSFQAVRRHAFADPFEAPGEADLTSHVDFEALAAVARLKGIDVHGPMPQGAFLPALGIAERAERLKRDKPPDVQADVARALARLTGPDAMGRLFQVMALSSPGLAPLVPFP